MRITVFGAAGPTGRHLTDQALSAGHEVVAEFRTAESSADGVFTARADLAASMLGEVEERRYVRAHMGVITTAVKPNIAEPIRHEGVKKK